MAHRPQFRGPPNWNGPPDMERIRLCQQIGFNYPPDHDVVYKTMRFMKLDGEQYLKQNKFHDAYQLYTQCIACTTLFPQSPHMIEEYPKLLCNRSLVCLKLRMFREAEEDASKAAKHCPEFVKAYWRAAQAVKGGRGGPARAVIHLCEGLVRISSGCGSSTDTLTFLTELCTLIPLVPQTQDLSFVNQNYLSKIVGATDPGMWSKVMQKLAASSSWQSVAMLVIGKHSGPKIWLDSICCAMMNAGKDVHVGSLLSAITPAELRSWGEQLAVKLIGLGAPVDEIGSNINKPTIHVAVEISLLSKKQLLLERVLQEYKEDVKKKNAQNSAGSTALHILVRSGQASTSHGLGALKLLLKYRLNPMIEDNHRKLPIAYLGQEERAYVILKKETKTVHQLKQDLEQLKNRGNSALKTNKLWEALTLYKEALEITQLSTQLYKEAAILYSNCANVYVQLENYEKALPNALAAVSCDRTYHKGYWWKGKILLAMGSHMEAFMAYMDGCGQASISPDLQMSFVQEAAILLKQISSSEFMTCYSQLNFVSFDLWSLVLGRLSRISEWKTIAFLVLGPDLEEKKYDEYISMGLLDPLCSGVAKAASVKKIVINTVFQFLQTSAGRQDFPWIDALMWVIVEKGDDNLIKTLTVNSVDTALHAVVRFSLIVGRVSLLAWIPVQDPIEPCMDQLDGQGNSLYHTVTRQRPIPPADHMRLVLDTLIDKQFDSMVRDRYGKLAVDYLDRSYPEDLFEMFFEASGSFRVEDVNRLKAEGNRLYKAGQHKQAISLYTQAIEVAQKLNPQNRGSKLTNRDMAVLYGNRAEAYIKISDHTRALADANRSVSEDGHWYKGHLRVGKVYRALYAVEPALKAFSNAYRDCGEEENIKVDIVMEICEMFPILEDYYMIERPLPEFPKGQKHIWARVVHKLLCDNNWEWAELAHYQFVASKGKGSNFTNSLRPFCNLKRLKVNDWAIEMIQYCLEKGASRNTISFDQGDTYLHAIVRIELVAGTKNCLLEFVLKKFCGQGSPDQHRVDINGNTCLHTAAKESGRDICPDQRNKMIILLLRYDVDPNVKNKQGKLAIDVLPYTEAQNREILKMAMYGKANMPKVKVTQPKPNTQQSHQKPAEPQQPEPVKPAKPKELTGCELCDQMFRDGQNCLDHEEIPDGYQWLAKVLLQQHHKGARHMGIQNKVLKAIVAKLGESMTPEIPNSLTEIPKGFYIQIIESLSQACKWRQMDALVRKYRAVKGSDQLKGFAAQMSIVPVIRDPSLKNEEDIKLQIVSNLLRSSATMGTDNGVLALQTAQQENHYKIVGKLIREGADTGRLSLSEGDTPIHAALTIVLEKDKALSLLEFLLDQYQKDPEACSHLNPEQLDKNGDCLFHTLAKTKYSNTALKVTELLCKRNISAAYYNKDGKLPVHYITRKVDRRLQFIKLAATITPTQEQVYSSKKAASKPQTSNIDDEDLQQFSRGPATEPEHEVREVNRMLSLNEMRKRKISDMIRLLKENKASIFGSVNLNISEADSDSEDRVDPVDEKKPKLEVVGSDEADKDPTDRSQKDEVEEEKMNTTCETEESLEFVDALEEISKDDLESIDDLPRNTVEKTTKKIVPNEDGVGQEANERVNVEGPVTIETVDKIEENTTKQELNNNEKYDSGGIEEQSEVGKKTNVYEVGKERVTPEVVEAKVEVDEIRGDIPAEGQDEMDVESESDDEMEAEEEEDFDIDAQVFDNLEWEVECTAEVWKTLRDKHVLPDLKRRIVHKIQLLAMGDWQPHLCKKLKHVQPSLRLYEAKFSKGSRIIWELAIAFSPRLSQEAENRLQVGPSEQVQPVRGGRIYSEIIRVWEIVLDHDKIYRAVQKIKRSHDRGEKCIIQKNLKGFGDEGPVASFVDKRYPRLFSEKEEMFDEIQRAKVAIQRFFPPASANDSEYHILKFYSFSSVLVSHVLQNVDTKVDFPFRVTDLEHSIINLKSKAPILLLGRSGTGKTTCCLYRLWSQFHTYWTGARNAGAPLLPRNVEYIHDEAEDSKSEDESSEDEEGSSDDGNMEEVQGACGGENVPCSDYSGDHDAIENGEGHVYDHLHQIFITKNSVLCNEVQKNFRELSHADDLMEEHVRHEEENLPTRLQDMHDYTFPLFLTSRQLLLLLDASLDPPHFFERKEDGSLKVDIAGWSDLDGPLSILPLLDEDSDAEDDGDQYIEEEEGEMEGDMAKQTASGKRKKVDPRREISYGVFVEEIWPRIKKGMQESYHPSLIWMEIMSFIKGSYEALSKPSGYLELKEYEKLGRKRAPNFSGQRDVIYNCYKRYEHFKKQNSLFDETDLVHDVFRRLRATKERPWVIHQIFVDETQDFTQAELCMMIRLCQNPNEMFLTGDTAQSIMRGIAFRFSDLRSLFYHAKQSMHAMGKTSAVEVPKQVYQLTHNYRSHAGILSLASSILELMVEFFPDSFDRLKPDQGLFNGPQPILLESCSFSDLAVLLRGNKRKTSHIEFGAHQAILVVNDSAREAIPEELRLGLVLTIYEAKGLEFDDVLLYNFFKDSQANKEWRVITDYLERQALQQKEPKQSELEEENLVTIDQEILSQSDRPRPLNFDANQHKVLNSELKHLYTALTRARVNVWIFDEHEDKRAPMFEFFKARKLVKSLTVSEINEESLTETVFAEKSRPEDWLRRGEDFMKHHLYQVAAKCFGMGGETEREKVALAHHQALLASRLKDHPRQMREEFLLAADLYLECNKPAKAAICLQNAREKELAAELFQKLGQFERAADIYKRLKQPIASGRCYEQLGNFNKAVEVLHDNECYTMALDTLKRYHMLIEVVQQKGECVPTALVVPAAFYTEEKLSHKAAELFHKNRNEERMLEALERFHDVEDQVQFLERRGYIIHAANTLQKHGEYKEAASLLLKYGKYDEASLTARKTLDEATIAQYLLAACRIRISKKKYLELNHKLLVEMVKETVQLFQTCKNNDGFGQAKLLLAQLTGDIEHVRQAWKAFQGSKNEAGLMECADWLIGNNKTEDKTVVKHVVESIVHMFDICKVLVQTSSPSGRERVRKLDEYYGLLQCRHDTLAIHPLEKPSCLFIVNELFKSKEYRKDVNVEIEAQRVHTGIVTFFLKRGLVWIDSIVKVLNVMRDKTKVCDMFQAGLECPYFGDTDKPCLCVHKPLTKDMLKNLIQMDILYVELEDSVHRAYDFLRSKLPSGIEQLAQRFIDEGERDMSEKYHACELLWNDLMPAYGHTPLIAEDSKNLLTFLRENNTVIGHFRRYLLDKWYDAMKEQKGSGRGKRLKCKAVRETNVFLLFEFGYHLFGFDEGRRKMQRSPTQEMTTLEKDLDRELLNKGRWNADNKQYYTLMVGYEDDGKPYVECVARRFSDAYTQITRGRRLADPFEAVFMFNKFMIQLNIKGDVAFLPNLKHYFLWIEFYTILAFLLVAKLKSVEFPDFVFILPSSYLQLLKFVEATFPSQSSPILDSIEWWSPNYKNRNAGSKMQERLKFYVFGLTGHGQNIRLIREALRWSQNDPHDYCLVERLLVLGMTHVCNVGKAVLPECEMSLLKSMSNIRLPEDGPARLHQVVNFIRKSRGIADVASTLIWLLEERKNGDEVLLVNKWQPNKKPRIASTALKDAAILPTHFFNEKTVTEMHSPDPEPMTTDMEPTMMESDLTEEEMQIGKAQKAEETRRERAAVVIQKWWRIWRAESGIDDEECDSSEPWSEIDYQFAAITVDSAMCGVCGVNFEEKLEEDLKYENSVFVGGDSVLNKVNSTPISPVSSGAVPRSPPAGGDPGTAPHDAHHPTSPQPAARQTFIWGTQTNTSHKPDQREWKLKKIRENHEQSDRHKEKETEFNFFKRKYKGKILPQLNKVKAFFSNEEYRLDEKEYCEKNYGRHVMDLERMQRKCKQIEGEVHLLITSRIWTKWGHIEQNLLEVQTDLKTVKPYVEEVQATLKQEEEERKTQAMKASAANAQIMEDDIWGEEDDRIEQVVEDPKNTRRKRKNLNRKKTKN